ncbi:uracil-DNA glycosylase [Methyloceanibacter sp.]|uniref:uracil-DNA glycosylase n=1 Tax=Methyloceanibacter sp. TaxID=1965321 RepID=UPI002D28F5E7|nr:uracil-DNA glycosylase [Methyloceanibacter sp.]HZP09554.1 uracil-DNA glycosylase [Methyloceanibacter sp.]
MAGSDPISAQALLAWYEAMGVDEAIGDVPVDRFAAPAREAPVPQARIAKAVTRPSPVQGVPSAGSLDRSSIAAATSLEALEAMVAAFDGCTLKRTAKTLCFARGSSEARLMLIGEAPGRDEDLQGRPFVGRAGQLLDRMLAAIGLDEGSVYITNTVYWRPPGNRTPTPEEIEACAPFLARQIELLSPDVLVLLGGAAAKSLLGVSEGIMRLRGKWLSYLCGGREISTLATLHPAFLLRNPEHKRLAWLDLLMIKSALGL